MGLFVHRASSWDSHTCKFTHKKIRPDVWGDQTELLLETVSHELPFSLWSNVAELHGALFEPGEKISLCDDSLYEYLSVMTLSMNIFNPCATMGYFLSTHDDYFCEQIQLPAKLLDNFMACERATTIIEYLSMNFCLWWLFLWTSFCDDCLFFMTFSIDISLLWLFLYTSLYEYLSIIRCSRTIQSTEGDGR